MNTYNTKKFTNWKNTWKSKEPPGLIEYISFNIYPEDVLIIGNLLFPEFVEIEDCIFLAITFDQDIYANLTVGKDYRKEDIEKTINRIHVYDIFANCIDKVDENLFEKVGELLKLSWSNDLKNRFPDRKFTVDLIVDDNEYGPVLTMSQTVNN